MTRRSTVACMRPPIFVWQPRNELLAFDSVEWAEEWTEPYDVDEGVVYDAEGRLLAFELDGPGRVWEKRVVLRERESEPTHEEELRAAIMRVSLAAGRKLDASVSLEQLLEEAVARFRVPLPRRRRRRFGRPS